jgi:hypothetical protein
MSNLNISPQTVSLTAGQAVTFASTDAAGKPALVTWSLKPDPAVGSLVTPPPAPGVAASPSSSATAAPSSSVTYVAPSPVPAARTIAIVASTATDSASATIGLTTLSIVPAKVDLSAGQTQKFSTIDAAVPVPEVPEKITWTLSPPLGTLDGQGLYTSPREIVDPTIVNVTATTPIQGKQAVAIVNLTATPWHGLGVDVLGGFLLLVFSLVFAMVALWPPALPSPDTARADRIDAEKTWEDKAKLYNDANAAAKRVPPEPQKPAAQPAIPSGAGNAPASTSPRKGKPALAETAGDGTGAGTGSGTVAAADALDLRQQAGQALDDAYANLRDKRQIEKEANDTNVKTSLMGRINREFDLLLLVLLGGALGSFLHTAQSYSDYVGNRTLKRSWAWWYSLRPFIGAGLALVFYAAVRGGVLAITTGSNAKASELNPFGVVSVAAMVGMFSKAATTKLGDVFDTLFKSDKPKDKDPVTGTAPDAPPSNQPAAKPAAGGATSTGK